MSGSSSTNNATPLRRCVDDRHPGGGEPKAFSAWWMLQVSVEPVDARRRIVVVPSSSRSPRNRCSRCGGEQRLHQRQLVAFSAPRAGTTRRPGDGLVEVGGVISLRINCSVLGCCRVAHQPRRRDLTVLAVVPTDVPLPTAPPDSLAWSPRINSAVVDHEVGAVGDQRRGRHRSRRGRNGSFQRAGGTAPARPPRPSCVRSARRPGGHPR